jgi:hypothetical protein
MKFNIWLFLEKSPEKIKISLEYEMNSECFTWKPTNWMLNLKADRILFTKIYNMLYYRTNLYLK